MLKWVWNSELHTFAAAPISLYKAGQVYDSARVPVDHEVAASPADLQTLARAHDLQYLHEVTAGIAANGFGNDDRNVVRHAEAAAGVMVKACAEALERAGDPVQAVVCAPVSGFHHAHYNFAEGFCTFNGLLAAVLECRVRYRGSLRNVLIIDGDAHYGNGTDDIIAALGLSGIVNLTHNAPRGGHGLDRRIWSQQIRGFITNPKPKWDLVIYQAGADAHVDDPYGDGYLTDDDWEARDRLVFQYCRAQRIPIVFNFAGGYNGEKTIELHRRTVQTARDIYRSDATAPRKA